MENQFLCWSYNLSVILTLQPKFLNRVRSYVDL